MAAKAEIQSKPWIKPNLPISVLTKTTSEENTVSVPNETLRVLFAVTAKLVAEVLLVTEFPQLEVTDACGIRTRKKNDVIRSILCVSQETGLR